MIRKGRYKYVYLDGADHQLFDIEADPGEWNNLCGNPEYTDIAVELGGVIESRFDIASITPDINAKFAMQKIVQSAMHTNATSWDYQPYFDARKQYMRADKSKKYIRT
ncbi:MAG: hypothetical protein OEQ39_07490 [Gammaproteobacteria bacterium]|nr:hypothetical protein [Gammaproteobacteria bacterium]MDH3467931.1 hypothetical protein [Gammaproteobacteria bacterium]